MPWVVPIEIVKLFKMGGEHKISQPEIEMRTVRKL
jgi:hypothetical protein